MTTTTSLDFLVDRHDLHHHVFTETALPALGDGEVLMRIERFAFTANNITYAAFGERMHYWNFFPAKEGFGRVPVWGFAEVEASNHPDIAVGTRYYGYYPMSSHLVVAPIKISPAGFTDGSAHRRELAAIYNLYVNTATDPGYDEQGEALQMLYRPLFMTSFLIDDFLADNDLFGAGQVIFSSASSKTAYGAAFLAAKREGLKVIGLTSAGNKAFVEGLGFYDEVVTYDAIGGLDAGIPTIYVDMAGSAGVRADVHNHFRDNLVYSCSVGASHWQEAGGGGNLPGAKPTLFFAPSQGQKRMQEWGSAEFQARTAKAWLDFIGHARALVHVREHKGKRGMAEVYEVTLEGRAHPRDGHIVII
jgi:hypothetical protein